MTDVRDGLPLDWSAYGLPAGYEAFLHGASVVYIWDGRAQVGIDTDRMTLAEIRQAVAVAVNQLEGACLNRAARRARQARERKALN